MHTSPIALLDRLALRFSPPLFDAGSLARIRKAACTLAPVPALGFECRLGGHSSQVDMQQPISVQGNGPALLVSHAQTMLATASPGKQAIWHKIQMIAQTWANSDQDTISELWLETDLDRDDPAPAPSVFFRLPDSAVQPNCQAGLEAVELLLGNSFPAALRAQITRCYDALPDGAFVGYMGLMLTRPGAGVRLIFKHLLPDAILPFLNRIRWPGRAEDAETLLNTRSRTAPEIRLCVDVTKRRVAPTLGLETYFPRQPDFQPEWHTYLDALIAQRLCTPEERDALLAWPYTYDPLTLTDWPACLIVASLLHPPDHFGQLRCGLSHIKLTHHPGSPVRAKVYFGFQHEWVGAASPLQKTT